MVWRGRRLLASSVLLTRVSATHGGPVSGTGPAPEGGESGGEDSGVTLVETLVALFLFAVLSFAVLAALVWSVRTNFDARNRQAAAAIASSEMDRIRNIADPGQLLDRTSSQTVNGVLYSTQSIVSPRYADPSADPCAAGGRNSLVGWMVDVIVTWANMGKTPPVRTDTLLTPGDQVVDGTRGQMGIRVYNELGSNYSETNMGVTVTGPASSYQFTDNMGCAFFEDQLPGTYSVGPALGGWVDPQGNPLPKKTLTVASGQATLTGFEYAPQWNPLINLTNGGYRLPANVSLNLDTPRWTPSTTRNFAGSGSTRSVCNATFCLYPFQAGYTGWVGSCSDSDPLARDTALARVYPTATRQIISSNGWVVVASQARVNVMDAYGTGYGSVQVRAVHDPDAGCPAGETWILGTTNSSGYLTTGLPWGNWRFELVGKPYAPSAGPITTLLTPTVRYNVINLNVPVPPPYDATITFQGGAFPAPPSALLTLQNSGWGTPGTQTYPGTTATRFASQLPAFPGGYRYWIGTCTAAGASVTARLSGNATAPAAMSTVHVLGADGSPRPGIQVVATAPADAGCPSGESWNLGTSDATGTFSVGLPFGTWTYTLVGEPYADGYGPVTATQSATNPAATINLVTWATPYAATVNLPTGTYPAPLSALITLQSTRWVAPGTQKFPGTTSSRSTGTLVAYPEGYGAWMGSCDAANPGSSAGRITGTGATVTTAQVDVNVQDSLGNPMSGVGVEVSTAADSGCSAGERWQLGTTPTTGLVRASLPQGTWQVVLTGLPAGSVAGPASAALTVGSRTTLTYVLTPSVAP